MVSNSLQLPREEIGQRYYFETSCFFVSKNVSFRTQRYQHVENDDEQWLLSAKIFPNKFVSTLRVQKLKFAEI